MQELMECSDIVREASLDKQTVIIQYDRRYHINYIKGYIHNRRRPNSTSMISNWIEIEAFINLNGDDTDKPENEWVRIVYECLEDNPKPHPMNTRFQDCLILHAHTYQIVRRAITNDRPRAIPTLPN